MQRVQNVVASSTLRSFLSHCSIKFGCVLAFVLSSSVIAQQPATAPGVAVGRISNVILSGQSVENDSRQPITWEHVYGTSRISIPAGSTTRYTWISDEAYLNRESSGWKMVQADTGESADWYDRKVLSGSLSKISDVSVREAERMAAGAWKLINHQLRIVVFEHNGNWIRSSLDGTQFAVVNGIPVGAELASLSPTGEAVAFVSRNELWVADFTIASVRQLTFDATEKIRNGKADWVYFEEVYNRRWDAFRWSPDGQKLLFQQFDDTNVPEFSVTDHTNVEPAVETENFPKAGETNPVVRLGIVSVGGGEITWVNSDAYPLNDLIITHFNWLPDSNAIYWYAQNRIQSWLDVIRSSPADGSSTVLMRDQTPAWVDNPGDATFLRDGSFLLFSERTGWRHLYRVSADGSQCLPITSGDWEVRSLLTIGPDEGYAIVSGTKDSPIAENVYRIALDPEVPEVARLTPEDGHHQPDVSPQGRRFVDSFSSLNTPAASILRDNDGTEVRRLAEPSKLPLEKYRFGNVELRDVPMADGSTTAAIFVFPPNFDPRQKHPVWLMTYGGPHSPGVRNAFSDRMREHLFANLRIVTVRFDPRTASGYGARSAWLAYRQLGVEETKDLVSLCDWLGQQGWADSTRIGMSGHSYGGYFTSYAMTHCDKLCAGIAGAPVTDWANYDTIYTERFMSTPQDNPDGYRKSSVVKAAADLNGRLLLLHGLLDDNVHPANSIQLMHQLQRSNKQFEVMFYPAARHEISGGHYQKLFFNFVVTSMGRPEAARK